MLGAPYPRLARPGSLLPRLPDKQSELPRPSWSSSSKAEAQCSSRGHGACSGVCMQSRRAGIRAVRGLEPLSANAKASSSSCKSTPLPCRQRATHIDMSSCRPSLREVRRLPRCSGICAPRRLRAPVMQSDSSEQPAMSCGSAAQSTRSELRLPRHDAHAFQHAVEFGGDPFKPT